MRLTQISLAGAPAEGPDLEYAKQQQHDEVIAVIDAIPGARRTSGVTWRMYAPEAAAEMLEQTSLAGTANANGLLAFLRENEGMILLVTTADFETPEKARVVSPGCTCGGDPRTVTGHPASCGIWVRAPREGIDADEQWATWAVEPPEGGAE